ncbi:MAG: glutathione peroxidase [Porticoccaceae bacterium]|nr:glutathione peroxidase [Porticoccaceae bacterium]MBT5578584.1 glutathione peroxidase [Porticoccaceae bacterium]MBT7376309.1 glutathione peroxidase [Porticoccaceae bacterium]
MSNPNSVYDFSVPTSTGEQQALSAYKGKAMLIVNTASKCGFTPQYEGLQNLYNSYAERGLEIIALPCNQFRGQEPGSNAEVQEFCQLNYGLSFPVMGKIEVNGPGRHPLYSYLTQQAGGLFNDNIKWNFTKFLVDRNGQVVDRFATITKPADLAKSIEKLL